ncbi:myb-like protein X [Panonychus citri]|uniref:myb-like protein X n=1 Tax=Panonychus citri TaxID=50023 RepID=UPI0023070297|nr:myb-like protein X [Panonychus citri]
MDSQTDSVNQSETDQSLRTDCATLGKDSTDDDVIIENQPDDAMSDESDKSEESEESDDSHISYDSDGWNKLRKRKHIETTQFFKDFLSNMKKKVKKKEAELKASGHKIRYQKARKSTRVYPFLLCFASKNQSNKHKSNGDVNSDDGQTSKLSEDLTTRSKEVRSDEMLENNSIKIISDNEIEGSSDAILELTFDEPKKSSEDERTKSEAIRIKMETINNEMLENNSIKIVTENETQGSSDAILELTFDEPKKTCEEKTESDLLRIKKELINDEMLENNSIKIVSEHDVRGSSDAILELTFDEPKKSSEDERTKSEAVRVKKETINDEMLEHNSIKILTENDTQGSSDAILELTFDEPKKTSDD